MSKEFGRKVTRYIYAVVLATLFPSVYLAYGLVTREVFNSRANEFIKNELVFEKSFIAKQNISADQHAIDITLIGEKISDEGLTELSKKLAKYQLPNTRLIVHQTVVKELDEASLKKSLLTDILNSNQETFETKNKQIQALQNEITNFRAQQNQQAESLKEQQTIFDELVAQYPQVQKLAVAKTDEHQTSGTDKPPVLLVSMVSKKTLSREDRRRIIAWLKVKTGVDQVKLTIEPL